MGSFPILYTERLLLRQLTLQDYTAIFDYFSKDEVTDYYDLDTLTSPDQAKQLIMAWEQRWERNESIRWGICFKDDPQVIGTIGFHNWSAFHLRTEVGYELSPQFWRQGIMRECLLEVLRYGFRELGFNRVEAMIDPYNLSSRKLLEKVGMKEEGLLREYLFVKGAFVDAVMFSILHREYEEGMQC